MSVSQNRPDSDYQRQTTSDNPVDEGALKPDFTPDSQPKIFDTAMKLSLSGFVISLLLNGVVLLANLNATAGTTLPFLFLVTIPLSIILFIFVVVIFIINLVKKNEKT